MPLSGKAVDELQNALISAFSADELTRLVRIHLDENLDAIAGDDNLSQTVFDLITWADRHGRLDELIRGAANVNPRNHELRTWIEMHSAQIAAGDLPQQEQPDAATTTTDPNRNLKIFLCHASEDKETVRKLYHQLKADGLDPWLDEENLLPGQNWRHEIPRAVRSADVVLVCLANHSVDKDGYFQDEIQFALEAANKQKMEQIYLIPARLEECYVPEHLSRWHWVDLFESEGYLRLVKALSNRAQDLGIHGRQLSPTAQSLVADDIPDKMPTQSQQNADSQVEISKPIPWIHLLRVFLPVFTIMAYLLNSMTGRGRSLMLMIPIGLAVIGSLAFSIYYRPDRISQSSMMEQGKSQVWSNIAHATQMILLAVIIVLEYASLLEYYFNLILVIAVMSSALSIYTFFK